MFLIQQFEERGRGNNGLLQNNTKWILTTGMKRATQ